MAQQSAGELLGTPWVPEWVPVAGARRDQAFLMPIVAALMMTVGLLAALGPARRGLAIQPTEALREE